MGHRPLDKGFWIVALSALLTLSGMSLLFCPTAQAHDPVLMVSGVPAQARSEASQTAMTLQPPDDDGDELLEHWSDPKFTKEERLQTTGILVFLAGACGAAARRRFGLRKMVRHD